MAIKAVMFDLDGTLLPMDQDIFVHTYFKALAAKLAPYGYEPKQLISAVWAGTEAMIKNDGKVTNEEAFWNCFTSVFGEVARADMPVFQRFYEENFDDIQAVCGHNPIALEVVQHLKKAGIPVGLATNPIFPAIATGKRIRWAGLQAEDFEFVTTYENSCYCKPNLRYYEQLLKQLNVAPEECLMVGNDVGDDMVTTALGMQVFLLTDCLINKTGTDISCYNHGDFPRLLEYIKEISA